MTDTTDTKALHIEIAELRLEIAKCYDSFIPETKIHIKLLEAILDQLEAERQQAAETNNINLNIKLSLHERMVKAEKEVAALKGGLHPVGEIVAWSGTNRDMGITRDIDFRFFRFDVKPGTKLYTFEPAPELLSIGELIYRLENQTGQTWVSIPRVRLEHAAWSQETFGNVGPIGPLKHLSKEALEAAAAPDDLFEWADMQFLFWDAQRRAGITDEQIEDAMIKKLRINKARKWPEPKDGEPRLHIRDGD
jgi:hypothetical protein